MKKLVVGILAHVDAGKTTLSEGMLYQSGCLKKLGRVDHQDAFLDTFALERQRGITIFSKQAVLPLGQTEVTLLDTPGHVDFSAEMERTLQVLDYAILVISGTDGVQGHTETLWRLLERYQVPTFLFINKMDLPGALREPLLEELKNRLGEGCVDFSQPDQQASWEEAALCDEQTLARYLEHGRLNQEELAQLVARRKLFPCYFGAALKLDGVEALLQGLDDYTLEPQYPQAFGARVYKIARDPQGNRLTYMKVTGGCLRVKDALAAEGKEKVDQIRIYSGQRYQLADQAPAGTVCAVTGLDTTYPGQGLGEEAPAQAPVLEPVLTYRVDLPQGTDAHKALLQLRQLEEEDPQLHIVWNEPLREIHMQLMGEVQLEILKQIIAQRFGMEVEFGAGNILYRETIARPVEGVGHFEPLRHYAEVHLLLEPLPRGSGLQFATRCSEDLLDRNWQRLVLTHLEEKTHLGVLTGSPITDMKITLVAGRAHVKHTEGGDFRQATYRAVRQGLMSAESILLEPWYAFRLEVPTAQVGRAMADLQRLGGQFDPPQEQGEFSLLQGAAPVATLRDYGLEVTAYTGGRGRFSCTLQGYEPCHNQQQVVEAIGYDCQRDVDNTGDSVFCAHGAGFVVKWDQVRRYMHVDSGLRLDPPEEEAAAAPAAPPPVRYSGSLEEDKELMAIYERTYGPIRRREWRAPQTAAQAPQRPLVMRDRGPEYLLVDGYNIIFAWEELKEVARDNLDLARQMLMDILSNYQGFKKCVVILVFDAYKVPGGTGEVSRYHNIYVVYTKEAETADAYIEKTTYEISKRHRVRVATSDNTEQLIILGHGALRLSAQTFRQEVEQVQGELRSLLEKTRQGKNKAIQYALEKRGAKGNERG